MAIRVANAAAMQAIPTVTFSASFGHACEVLDVEDIYIFVVGNPFTPATNSIYNSNDGLGQWVRSNLPLSGVKPAAASLMAAGASLSAMQAVLGLPGGGTTPGRFGISVLLDIQILTAATSYTSVAITPGLYSKLYWTLRTSAATCTGGVITLTSLTGAYTSTEFYELGATLGPEATVANWPHYIQGGGTGAGAGANEGEVEIRTGFQRRMKSETHLVDPGAGPLYRRTRGFNADTTHDVTALAMTFTGGNVTGIVELWGM